MGRHGIHFLWCDTCIDYSIGSNNTLTEIEPCPKCKKKSGWEWHWGKNDGMGTGYGECKGCGAKF